MFQNRSLYAELKAHIEDIYNKGWIINSSSSCLSPVVPGRKKDGSLRLYCDYRQLNSKTIQDRQPLPKIQNILEKLREVNTLVSPTKERHTIKSILVLNL